MYSYTLKTTIFVFFAMSSETVVKISLQFLFPEVNINIFPDNLFYSYISKIQFTANSAGFVVAASCFDETGTDILLILYGVESCISIKLYFGSFNKIFSSGVADIITN